MKTIVLDCETSGTQTNKSHPFDYRNKLCTVGILDVTTNEHKLYKIEYDDSPYGDSLREIQQILSEVDVVVTFNGKFDLHYLRRYGCTLNDRIRLFDCQLAFYVLQNQKTSYPSLNGVCYYYGVPQKLDVVKEEYWDKGIDTPQVPLDILNDYLLQDLYSTRDVYLKIQEEMKTISDAMRKLISLEMQDCLVLEDIEYNGLLINKDKSFSKGNELLERIAVIDKQLIDMAGYSWFNPGSREQLSALLYGGQLIRPEPRPYTFVYKDGREAIKYKKQDVVYSFDGIYKPIEGSELSTPGVYSTDESTLKTLSETVEDKTIINKLLERFKLSKLVGTYYHGYLKRLEEYGWTDDIIHSTFNQVVAETGRLSSTKPNVQNIAEEVKEIFITRFKLG